MPDLTPILPSSDGHHDREAVTDLALHGRAVREHWPIPPEYRKVIVAESMRFVATPDKPDKTRQRAMELIAKLDRDNFDRAQADKPTPQQHGASTTTVNVGVLNALNMQQIAADPAQFDRLMALAEAVQAQQPTPHTNGSADAHGRNGTANGTH